MGFTGGADHVLFGFLGSTVGESVVVGVDFSATNGAFDGFDLNSEGC